MWKVRAQFKWCADQNYGFEVWSKGLPACNQRCDNRWAHRKMSNYEHNNNEWMATTTTTSATAEIRCEKNARRKKHEVRPKERTTIHSINVHMWNKKAVCMSRTYRFLFEAAMCVCRIFHRYFSLFLYRCSSKCVLCSARVLRSLIFSFSLFLSCSFDCYGQPFGVAKRLVCSYLLVCSVVVIVFTMHIGWCGCCSFVFAHEHEHLLISFGFFHTRVCCYQRWPTPMLQHCWLLCSAECIIACPYANLNRIKTERESESERDIRSTFIYFSIACASDLQVSAAFPFAFAPSISLTPSLCIVAARMPGDSTRKTIVSAFSALFI